MAALGDGAAADDADPDRGMVREERGRLWTRFPPPAGYRGTGHGDGEYCRTLTKAETAAFEGREARRNQTEQRRAARRRSLFRFLYRLLEQLNFFV
jgi:hypothetical protein